MPPPPLSSFHPPSKTTMQNPQNTPHLHFPPPEYPTTGDPLSNLSTIQSHLNSLSQTLSVSVNSNTPLSPLQSSTISSQLSNAILHVIINGASLITSSSSHTLPSSSSSDGQDLEIIELDVDTLTADQSHVCEFCGKGFKRDANLRMHMRAHGDQFKTLESLAKPSSNNNAVNNNNPLNGVIRKVRFSCPYVGCERNKSHKKFRPLKSAVCVKNHFKRFHCAKMFTCNKCKCKSFSVLADLKRHMKNCATSAMTSAVITVELCSCGLKFGTKDELFGHVSVSEGHMPATYDGNNDSNNNVINDCNNNNNNNNNKNNNNNYYYNNNSGSSNNKIEDYEGFGLIEDDQDMRLWSSIEELFNF